MILIFIFSFHFNSAAYVSFDGNIAEKRRYILG